MRLLALALVVFSGLLQLVCAQQAFLQGQLPLKVLVTTPSELASDGAAQPVTLTGRQAITVSGLAISPASETGSQGANPWQSAKRASLQQKNSSVWVGGRSSSCPCSLLAASYLEPSASTHTSPSS